MKMFLGAMAAATAAIAVPASAATVTYTGGGFNLPDLATGVSTINVAGSGTITGLSFTLNNFSHSFYGDLHATLTFNGTTAVFLDRNSTGGSDFGGNYTFADGNPTLGSNNSGGVIPTGTYGLFTPLSQFYGMSGNGDWTLTIYDEVGGDAGALGGWTLAITTATVGAVPEPSTWAMMIIGFGAAGTALRRRRATRTSVRFA